MTYDETRRILLSPSPSPLQLFFSFFFQSEVDVKGPTLLAGGGQAIESAYALADELSRWGP